MSCPSIISSLCIVVRESLFCLPFFFFALYFYSPIFIIQVIQSLSINAFPFSVPLFCSLFLVLLLFLYQIYSRGFFYALAHIASRFFPFSFPMYNHPFFCFFFYFYFYYLIHFCFFLLFSIFHSFFIVEIILALRLLKS